MDCRTLGPGRSVARRGLRFQPMGDSSRIHLVSKLRWMLGREAHHTQQATHGDFSQFETELLPDQIL